MLAPVAPVVVGGNGVPEHVIGGDGGLVLIAGPCVIESEDRTTRICAALCAMCASLDIQLIFKASFDKANRTSLTSFRGPGLTEGLAILQRIRHAYGVPVTTDVHQPEQAGPAGEVVDLVQVPAFLSRQTDLLVACAQTGKPVNVKKGQFMAPTDMGPVVAKLVASGAAGVMLTERGSSFGYNNLVVDMRGLPTMRGLGVPVCFDATHSVQRPGGLGATTGGDRSQAPHLARAAVAVGVDAIFMEVHDDPDAALSDGPNMIPLGDVPALLERLVALDKVTRS